MDKQPITEADYQRAADVIGCDLTAIKAVVAVESNGRSFDAAGRPVALFEKHYFFRNLPEGELRDRAVEAGLARPSYVPGDYPNGPDGVWAQIAAACEISEDAALQSVSWGLGQVMGTFWMQTDYPSIAALVEAMWTSAAAQLDLMVAFIVKNNLQRYLISQDWAGFARRYNGPAYATNRYDEKLAEAYARFS